MTLEGVIQNGVVVFATPVHFPDGTAVRVEAVHAQPRELESPSVEDDPLLGMAELAMDAGAPDLAINADHYLYGHPKVIDGP